jgi:tetratricopeptide (TPR) repeat protein
MGLDGFQPAELKTLYDRAMGEFRSGNNEQALADLENIDRLEAAPKVKAELLNLRGVILTRQCNYEGAEDVLRQALNLNPQLWNAGFNLAEIPFLKKDWPAAQHRFEALLALDDGGMDLQTRQLIQYKILLTLLWQGKENAVETTLREVDSSDRSPTLYFVRAAMAWKQHRTNDAKAWQRKAESEFSPALNRLYAESFYEIGWQQRPAGVSPENIDIIASKDRPGRSDADTQAILSQAESAFLAHHPAAAFNFLDDLDRRFPRLAASHNLRGEILLGENKLDEAEKEFLEANAEEPNLHEAAYNLAEVAFRKKQYGEARGRLERLFAATPGGDSQAAQLMKFKVFLTFLLEGLDERAQQLMNQFQFTGATPALYYAQAAWAFQHANPDRGRDWVESARKIYSPELNMIFASSFYDIGWLDKSSAKNARLSGAPDMDQEVVLQDFSPRVSISLTNWQLLKLSMNKDLNVQLNGSVRVPERLDSHALPENRSLPEVTLP